MNYRKLPGFYILHHRLSGMYYAGSSKNVYNRLIHHRRELTQGKHYNQKLSSVVYDWSELSIEVTYTGDVEKARDLEQTFLDQHVDNWYCCNVGTGARSAWVKGRMSAAMKDIIRKTNSKPFSNERKVAHGLIMSEVWKDGLSAEHRQKISRSMKSNPAVAEHRVNLTKAQSYPLFIDGVRYESVSQAFKLTGIATTTIARRANSTKPEWGGWRWADASKNTFKKSKTIHNKD